MSCRPSDRLPHLQLALQLSTPEFSLALGLPLRRTRRLLRPDRQPSVGLLARVQRSFPQVNAHWLLTGEGEMFLPPPAGNTGNAIGINYGTATQTIHYHFEGLPAAFHDRTYLIRLLELQLHHLKSAA